MNNHRSKIEMARKIPPPPSLEDGYDAIIAYHNKYSLDELERAGYAEEPSPEHIRDLEESAERVVQRQEVKGLAGEYPKSKRELKTQLVELLNRFAVLKPVARKELARRINVIADKARDLDEIAQRLLNENHSLEEIAELLYAFQDMAHYIRSYSEKLGIPIVEIFDHAKGFGSGSNPKQTEPLSPQGDGKAKGFKKRTVKR